MVIMRILITGVFVLAMLLPAYAADFPKKTILIISPYAPGDAIDNTARVLAEGMGKKLGVPVVVQNIAGGSGVTGMSEALKAAPDGHTLIMGAAGAYINAPLISNTGYGIDDFEPLARLVMMPLAIAVNENSPFKDLKDLVQTAQKKKLTYCTPSANSTQRVAFATFAMENNFQPMAHIGGQGGAGTATKALTGEVDFSFTAAPVFYPLAKGGKLRLLAVASEERLSYLPDVPTFKEQGFETPENLWFGILVRKGVPADVLQALKAVIKEAAQAPETIQTLEKFQIMPAYMDSAEFRQLIDETMAKRLKVMPEIGLIKKK